jgi:hypothetical protein
MALLDLKTDLKSLKYGRDTPGGGDSGQPYIQANIPTGDTTSVPFDDGFIRGGAVGAARASIADLKRISSFFKSKPHGTLFIARQVGLQLSNPRPEVRQSSTNIDLVSTNRGENRFLPNNKKAGFEDIGATRTYNLGLNTLAQIPVNAFGIHFYRHGLTPVFGDAAKYEEVARANNQGDGSFNKLVSITKKFKLGEKILSSNNDVFGRFGNVPSEFLGLEDARRLQRADRRVERRDNRARVQNGSLNSTRSQIRKDALMHFPRIDPTTLIVDRYIGGPGSIYGVGETIIPRTSNTEDKFKIDDALLNADIFSGKSKTVDGNGQPIEIDYAPLLGNIFNYGTFMPTASADIKKGIDQKAINLPFITPFSANYNQLKLAVDKNKDGKNYSLVSNTLGVGRSKLSTGYDPASNFFIDSSNNPTYTGSAGNGGTTTITINSSWKDINREKNVGSANQDQINLTPLFSASFTVFGPNTKSVSINGTPVNVNDFVNFRILSVGDNLWTIFRAYLTQFSDSTDAKWNNVSYTGRGEDFYIYGGYSRKINIGFKVAALSAEEMKPMYQKLNYLMGNVMPIYTNNLMRGPFVRMTVGNWLNNQDGILNNVSYTIPQDSPWEIGLNNSVYTGSLVLPHIVEVQMTFTPIGSQTNGQNKISERSTTTSHIAQNIGKIQYIQ